MVEMVHNRIMLNNQPSITRMTTPTPSHLSYVRRIAELTQAEVLAIAGDSPHPREIVFLRHTLGMSQDKFGALVGKTRRAVQHWESGQTPLHWVLWHKLQEIGKSTIDGGDTNK